MDELIKQIIDETFKSKKQARLFYAKANDKSLPTKERKKWKKWASEFSDKTNFKKLPQEASEEDVTEIVDGDGNIATGDEPLNSKVKYITSKSTTDDVRNATMGQMGTFGIAGGSLNKTLKYWAEADMSKALGYQDTLGQDDDVEDAEEHFEEELGLSDDETKDRLEKMGYDKNLPKGKVRLIENPKKYVEEYLESIMASRTKENDVVEKEDFEEKPINDIIIKQINVLKHELENNKISFKQIEKYFKNNE